MNIFKNLPKRTVKKEKQETVIKSYNIDATLYSILQDITTNDYHTDINEILNLCIDNLIKEEKIDTYELKYKNNYIKRSFRITSNNLTGLKVLEDKYKISIQKLINIAIRNSLLEANYKID